MVHEWAEQKEAKLAVSMAAELAGLLVDLMETQWAVMKEYLQVVSLVVELADYLVVRLVALMVERLGPGLGYLLVAAMDR